LTAESHMLAVRDKRLRKTYNPANAAGVRRLDEDHAFGARKFGEQKPDKSVRTPVLLTLLEKAAKPGK
jgi:hypothetical protein